MMGGKEGDFVLGITCEKKKESNRLIFPSDVMALATTCFAGFIWHYAQTFANHCVVRDDNYNSKMDGILAECSLKP